MSSPFNWQFPQRNQTMYMATIQSSTSSFHNSRQSSFQRNDIPGSQCRQQIPTQVTRENFSNSSFVEAVPSSHVMKSKYIGSNNLRTDDIDLAQPSCNQFKTKRVTNPIMPKYQLPYVAPVDPEPVRKFMRNSLDISDIKTKIPNRMTLHGEKQPIDGSKPSRLFRKVEAVQRLNVKDINRDGSFISKRTLSPTNPLEPSYTWRDKRDSLNQKYGEIGNHPKLNAPLTVNKPNHLSYSTYDIEGAKANSYNEKRYFYSQRRSIKDPLNVTDIPKTHASSLKKGISTSPNVNPLMPQYNYPSSRY